MCRYVQRSMYRRIFHGLAEELNAKELAELDSPTKIYYDLKIVDQFFSTDRISN